MARTNVITMATTAHVVDHDRLTPFSDGPTICPGRHLVLMLTSQMLAALLMSSHVDLVKPKRPDPRKSLPGTLNHFGLRFRLEGVTQPAS